ncbi:MAG: putative hydrolases or acyltransferases (alpha/beta hydrolase superfamily) [Promethearchaeota archaeon]|nr:MAG: putative hydrolases or acyltransferases (alpha/beta hydrolase superfamily) [Candidatus Lokiarchaeota archaeon]
MVKKEFTAEINDIQLACARWGEGNDIPIILVHGWTGFKELWDSFAPKLEKNGYDVVAPDLRGHGDSSKPDMEYTHEIFSKDILELSKSLGWNKGYVLLGQSMGGYIVLDYALRFPETLTHVIPSNTSVYLSRTLISKIVWNLTVRMYKKSPEKMMYKMFPRFFMNPPAQEVIDEFVQYSNKTSRQAGLSAIKYCLKRNLEPELHKIQTPTLVISSEHDQSTLRKATLNLHKLIPNSELVDIPNTGHLPFMENPEVFLKAIINFTK